MQWREVEWGGAVERWSGEVQWREVEGEVQWREVESTNLGCNEGLRAVRELDPAGIHIAGLRGVEQAGLQADVVVVKRN